VLTDDGAQFTGRHLRPQPVEVLFERVCRENGFTARRTRPRSPTTTGKIERLHKTLQAELLDQAAPFASLQAAQETIDAWADAYNQQRPHQALGMATPVSAFRRAALAPPRASAPAARRHRPAAGGRGAAGGGGATGTIRAGGGGGVRDPGAALRRAGLVAGRQQVGVSPSLAGRTLTLWADLRSITCSWTATCCAP
jgi:hypothetical protein